MCFPIFHDFEKSLFSTFEYKLKFSHRSDTYSTNIRLLVNVICQVKSSLKSISFKLGKSLNI